MTVLNFFKIKTWFSSRDFHPRVSCSSQFWSKISEGSGSRIMCSFRDRGHYSTKNCTLPFLPLQKHTQSREWFYISSVQIFKRAKLCARISESDNSKLTLLHRCSSLFLLVFLRSSARGLCWTGLRNSGKGRREETSIAAKGEKKINPYRCTI